MSRSSGLALLVLLAIVMIVAVVALAGPSSFGGANP